MDVTYSGDMQFFGLVELQVFDLSTVCPSVISASPFPFGNTMATICQIAPVDIIKAKEEDRDQEAIQSSTTFDLRHHMGK